jgi:hypothetical protein
LKWKDYSFEADVIPTLGDYHNINFRVQGGIRSYAVGLAADQKLALYKNENGYRKLASVDFCWQADKTYTIRVEAIGNQYRIFIDNQQLIEYIDQDQPYLFGQVGFSNFHGSHTHYKGYKVKG